MLCASKARAPAIEKILLELIRFWLSHEKLPQAAIRAFSLAPFISSLMSQSLASPSPETATAGYEPRPQNNLDDPAFIGPIL